MKSTGESMGIDKTFEAAFFKAFIAANNNVRLDGNILISVRDLDKNEKLIEICQTFLKNGFKIFATKGTFDFFCKFGISNIQKVSKLSESRPNILDMILNLDCSLYINTSNTSKAIFDGMKIRRAAMTHKIPCIRNLSAAFAISKGIDFAKNNKLQVYALQDL